MLSRSMLLSTVCAAFLFGACDDGTDPEPTHLERATPVEQTVTLVVDEPVERDSAPAVTEVVFVQDADGTSVWGHDANGEVLFEAEAPGTAAVCPGDGGTPSNGCPTGYRCCEPSLRGCSDCRPSTHQCP